MTVNESYNQINETERILDELLKDPKLNLPAELKSLKQFIKLENDQSNHMILPCILKECEVSTALKSLEGMIAALISKQRYGFNESEIKIDLQHSLMFLFMTYLASVNDYTKLDEGARHYLKNTDLNSAQSNQYRRMSANLYKTKDERYYHIHGSLEASETLNLIGLPSHNPELKDYMEIVNTIQNAVSKYNCDDLERLNVEKKQAGVEAIKYEDFLKTPHGKLINEKPYWEIDQLENESPPCAYSTTESLDDNEKPQILKGIKVLELCRIIAGPTIGRILAEYGAEVLKVTYSNKLPDVPFFQIDGNIGKHCCDLNLKDPKDRLKFEELLKDADVIIDGYRKDAISKLGYGPQVLKKLGIERGKGYIYASENCFGFEGQYSGRAGWQQIADCYSGVAWIHGTSLGQNEPIIPPFPMSDYGTGCIVAISVLLAIFRRATNGGSYWCKSSLVQYDLLLLRQGNYPSEIWEKVKLRQSPEVFQLRYYDSVDRISSTCLRSMRSYKPELFIGDSKYMDEWKSEGFKGTIKVLKPVARMKCTRNGFNCSSRPNGFDKAEWWV